MLVQGIRHLQLYAGDGPQMAHYLQAACGFAVVGRSARDADNARHRTFFLRQGAIALHVTAGLDAGSEAAEHVRAHGSGVKDIAFEVSDLRAAFVAALRAGARAVHAPAAFNGPDGEGERAVVSILGDLTHSLIQRAPRAAGRRRAGEGSASLGLEEVDHLAICVPEGRLDDVVRFYRDAFGFVVLHEEFVATARSAMRSTALQNQTGSVKLVFVEPAHVEGGGESQIATFLRNHGGPGVQHIAFLVNDILTTSHGLRSRGMEFLDIPDEYYEVLPQRIGGMEEDFAALHRAGVLADRDEWGYLLQQFTKPVLSRDTFFLEIIQRHDARGFGSGNIRALFEAVERRQLTLRAVGEVRAA